MLVIKNMFQLTKLQKNIIENNYIALASINENNTPHCIVVEAKVISYNELLITDNFMKQTVKNILKNKNVSLVGWNKEDIGFEFVGEAEYYNEGLYLEQVKKLEANKGYPAKGAIVIKIISAKGLAG